MVELLSDRREKTPLELEASFVSTPLGPFGVEQEEVISSKGESLLLVVSSSLSCAVVIDTKSEERRTSRLESLGTEASSRSFDEDIFPFDTT